MRLTLHRAAAPWLAIALAACGGDGSSASSPSAAATAATDTSASTTTPTRFKAEVWADNWFAAYVGETLVGEDSVPITTERSFNSETFYFDASPPFELNVVIKDYKQNDTGLEYIGTDRQQMGDGGFIAQLTDTATGRVVAVSDTSWRCTVIHKAPLNKSCEKDSDPASTCLARIDAEPAGWKSAGYDTSAWEQATAYTEAQVGVKEGYFDIAWNAAARLIWTSDLQADNTLLCKVSVKAI
jgi:hypothetical protein